jgi:hypothetical protein
MIFCICREGRGRGRGEGEDRRRKMRGGGKKKRGLEVGEEWEKVITNFFTSSISVKLWRL